MLTNVQEISKLGFTKAVQMLFRLMGTSWSVPVDAVLIGKTTRDMVRIAELTYRNFSSSVSAVF